MKLGLSLIGMLLLVVVVIAACGGSTVTPEAVMEGSKPDASMEKTESGLVMEETDSDDMMMDENSADSINDEQPVDTMENHDSADMAEDADDMMNDGSTEDMAGDADPDDMVKDNDSDDMMEADDSDYMMKDDDSDDMSEGASQEPMADLPAWFTAELTDVTTGETFSISDRYGDVILVETMAIWCSNCLRQQNEVKALHEALDGRDGWSTVVLDIDLNENAEDLKAYAAKHGFDWTYAVAPRDVAREIGQLYGDQFLNPPSTPILLIDQDGQVHPLPFGRKDAAELQATVESFLSQGG